MEPVIHRQSILNVVKASAADIDSTSMPGYIVLPGLNPIPASTISKVDKTIYAAEVRQFITVTIPTIVASTVYGVQGGELQSKDQNQNFNKLHPFKTTAPAVLSGTALTDKVNVAFILAWKINQKRRSTNYHLIAGPVATFTNATTAYAGAIGDVIVGLTSGAKAIVAKVNSGTEKLVLMQTTQDFTDTEAVSINGVVTTTTAATNVYTGNLGILDDAGYYPALGHRSGASSWAPGPNITTVTPTTAAVYGFGDGARMLDDVPRLEPRSPNLAYGQWNFATNDLPVASKKYNRFVITYANPLQAESRKNVETNRVLQQAIWVDKDEAEYGDFETAIEAL